MSTNPDVPSIQDRSRFLLTIAAIAVSVLLFACAGDRRSEESADVPLRPKVSEAGVNVAAPPSVPARPEPVPHPVVANPVAAQAQPVFGTPTPVVTSEPPAAQEPTLEEPPSAGGARVFSNKDLRRYARVKEEFGLGRDVVTVDLTPKQPVDGARPAEPMSDAQREEEVRDTMKKINELNAEAAYLKSRVPSLHNPFLARVPPSESDSVAEAGMDNAQRLERVQTRLSQVDAQLNQLQRRLAELHQPDPGRDSH